MGKYLLGIDIGTSGTKTVLFDHLGATVASATAEYPMHQPKIGWAEQDPADWWRAVHQSIAMVMGGIDPAEVSGIGLSGQMHGMVLLGSENELLRSSIIWCDQRTQAECDQITEIIGAQRLIEITANPALTGFTASKILWVKNHQPEIFERIKRILLPKDYIRFCLTGEFATEVSDASGMQLLDVPNRCWSREIVDKLGLEMAWLSKVYESYEVSGALTREAAALTGLLPGTPVVGGGGDQAAGAVGNGIVMEGIVSATLGTSGVVFAHTDQLRIDPQGRVHTFCHAVPGCWHIMGVTQAAGLSLQWLRNNFCGEERELARFMGVDAYDLMAKQAEAAPPGCNGLIYLPYMMGERTPHLDADAKAVFFGLSAIHDRRDMIRAVMEGVSYSMLDCLSIIRGLGASPSEIRASGGGGRSPLWRSMMADMFGAEVTTVNAKEGPAMGAALLAGVGTGVYNSVPEACDAVINRSSSQAPDAARASVYKRFYPVYKNLYRAVKPQYDEVAKILRS